MINKTCYLSIFGQLLSSESIDYKKKSQKLQFVMVNILQLERFGKLLNVFVFQNMYIFYSLIKKL